MIETAVCANPANEAAALKRLARLSLVRHRPGQTLRIINVVAGGQRRPLQRTVTFAPFGAFTKKSRSRTPRLEIDPDCGHTVRSSFRGYEDLVESFLAEAAG